MTKHQLDMLERWRYSDEEWERLRIRHAPLILRPFWYLYWVPEVMPKATGTILQVAIVLLCLCLAVGIVVGLLAGLVWAAAHAAWIFWLFLGGGLALIVRVVLRDVVVAEIRVQRSIAAKENARKQNQE